VQKANQVMEVAGGFNGKKGEAKGLEISVPLGCCGETGGFTLKLKRKRRGVICRTKNKTVMTE